MNIVIANRQRTKKINTRLLKQIAGALLEELQVTEAELGINLVDEREMTLVNETFLQHAGSTDVITFDHSTAGGGSPESRHRLQGELFISVDDAISQGKQFGATWQSEIVRYIVHGFLHLRGHDDVKPALRRRMKREENRLLRGLARRFSLAQISRASKIRA